VITPNLLPCIARSVKICFCLFVNATILIATPTMGHAIPSPELVLGSVSSLSQILAVVAATLSGFGAVIAARLGIRTQASSRRYPVRLITGLVLLAVLLAFANHWQWQTHRSAELQRLQATLTRPAQFDGTTIKDAALKETSYDSQETHPQGITTAEAANLLSAGQVNFFDIRETAENAMGTLPGSTHIRFPDFLQSPPVSAGETVVLFCHNGNRSSETCAALAKLGIDCRFIAGGIEKWIVESRPFSDSRVQELSDLRAIPTYPNKSRLIGTEEFSQLVASSEVQIVDTRSPGDFAAGHLPGAINIPVRALTTTQLQESISSLRKVPTVAACYDRRSCFMSQVLGLELTEAGIPFAGRYTLPWEYFIPPAPKPHVVDWLASQETGLWDTSVDLLSRVLLWAHEHSHLILGLLALAVTSRLLVLPLALKSERDQITLRAHKVELDHLKADLADDPIRKSRAIREVHNRLGLTPMRNLAALLFLPVMMLGLQAVELASAEVREAFLWVSNLGAPDPYYLAPGLTCALAAVYLLVSVAKSARAAVLWCGLGLPLLFALVMNLSAAGNFYLFMSLTGLLIQYAYVSESVSRLSRALPSLQRLPKGTVAIKETRRLTHAGNKALRLSQMANAGFPVPPAVVLTERFLTRFQAATATDRTRMAHKIWRIMGPTPCAVRSSASQEDGADHSFAGVFESVLDVRGDQMCSAIETVHASFSDERARSYQINDAGHGNILVQHMIDATFAGVLFTQDPQAPGMMLLEWVEGCGDDLVSGRKTPGTLRAGRYSKSPAPDQDLPPFAPEALLELGLAIENLFGTPQDIEWAWMDGEFWILQSRDVTTMAVGSSTEQATASEWRSFFNRFKDRDPDENLIEQDEMSEVLPRPSPLSFALMAQLWSPGGSLDLACRALGLPYALPECQDAHLVRLFGKTYVDTHLKQHLALDLSGRRAVALRKQLAPVREGFEREVLPKLRDRVDDWRAIRFEALPRAKLLKTITDLQRYFVTEIYVEAEKINILAALAMRDASQAAQGDPALRSYLMQADLEYSPASLLAQCDGPEQEAREKALALMGHRAMFDYELSSPRYHEAPSLLYTLLEPSVAPLPPTQAPSGLPADLQQQIELAIAFQDLKERAKHEALRVLSELRRALLALAEQSGLGALVFHLTLPELVHADWEEIDALRALAQARSEHDKLCQDNAPTQAQLTLKDCEQLSAGTLALPDPDKLGGTCVAGSGDVTGRVFRVHDEMAHGSEAFAGFMPGDIIVCHMVNPAWLPQVQKASAVVSVVGGWLSHMAIVAREKNILMVVGAKGTDSLIQGQKITVHDSGDIEAAEAYDALSA